LVKEAKPPGRGPGRKAPAFARSPDCPARQNQLDGADGAEGAGGGAAGNVEAGDGPVSRMDRLVPIVPRFSRARLSDKAIKAVARIAVARVNKLAVPRPLMNEPMPWEVPMPRPPPSLRWISTTPISARVTNKWMISRTVLKMRFRMRAAEF
jgi:hypothetical protein